MGRVANLTLRQMGSGQWDGVDISQGRLDLEDRGMHFTPGYPISCGRLIRLPRTCWTISE